MTRKGPVQIRDKSMTRQRLIAAVGSLLAREGFKGMGVNAVAREAGVDKVLIYRYFGGLPGLIAAFGQEGDFWPSTLELAGGDIKRFAALAPEKQLKVFSHQFIQGLRNRPVTICIMAWEMVEANELTRELESVREQGILSFFQMFFRFGKNDPDFQTCIMLVGAAISYLLIRSGHIDVYGGIGLETDADWERIESGIHRIIQGLLETQKTG